MGLSKFLNIKVKKDNEKKDVPLPPQKPSTGSSSSPKNTDIPPPPKPGSMNNDAPLPPPSGPKKDALEDKMDDAPLPPPPGMAGPSPKPDMNNDAPLPPPAGPPSPPKGSGQEESLPPPGEPTPPPAGVPLPPEPKPAKDSMPPPPVPRKELDFTKDLDTPSPAQETSSLDDAGFDLPSFDEEDIKVAEKAEDMDWTGTTEEDKEPTTKEETPETDESEEDDLEVPEDLPDFTEDSSEDEAPLEKPKRVKEQPQQKIHTAEGDLYVRAENYKDLFDSIKDMKTDINTLEKSLHDYGVVSEDQDKHYQKVADMLNHVQNKLMDIDTKLFER